MKPAGAAANDGGVGVGTAHDCGGITPTRKLDQPVGLLTVYPGYTWPKSFIPFMIIRTVAIWASVSPFTDSGSNLIFHGCQMRPSIAPSDASQALRTALSIAASLSGGTQAFGLRKRNCESCPK